MEYNDGVDITLIREEIKKRAGVVNLSNVVRHHTRCMKKNKNFPYGQCCCNCRFHLKDSSHPDTDGKSIMKQRGWICNPPEMSTAFSEWEKHGFCEMWAESPERVPA